MYRRAGPSGCTCLLVQRRRQRSGAPARNHHLRIRSSVEHFPPPNATVYPSTVAGLHQPAAPPWAARPPFMLPPATRNLQPSASLQPSPTRCRPDQSASSSADILPTQRSAHTRQHCSANRTEIRPHRNRAKAAKKWQPVIKLRNRQRPLRNTSSACNSAARRDRHAVPRRHRYSSPPSQQ